MKSEEDEFDYQQQGLEMIKDTLWYELLTQTKPRQKQKVANVLVLGDPGCGKKSLINSMLKRMGLENQLISLVENSILKDFSGKFEEVYVVDYKYMVVNKYHEDDENFEELGKINFYIFNQKHEVTFFYIQYAPYSTY